MDKETKIFLICIVICLVVFSVNAFVSAEECPEARYMRELTAYVKDFYRNSSKTKMRKALQHIPAVIKESLKQQWDPLFVAVIITCESGWKPHAVGKLGERGLTQVHGIAAKGYDLTIPEEQIKAGVDHLSLCRNMCGDNKLKVTSCYMTGKCGNTGFWNVQWRMRRYKKAVKMFGDMER